MQLDVACDTASVVLVLAQAREFDRAQHAWDRAIQIAKADGDIASVEQHRGNLRMLDNVREQVQRAGSK